MQFHPEISQSQDYQQFADAKKFTAECVYFSHLKFALLSVVGIVDAPNPGAHPRLSYAEPQGCNPKILLLNLVYDQEPGIWNQVITPKPVGYSMTLSDCDIYDQLTIIDIAIVTINKTKI